MLAPFQHVPPTPRDDWPGSEVIFMGNEYRHPSFHLVSVHRAWLSPPSLCFQPEFFYVQRVSCRQPGAESTFIIPSDLTAVFRPFTFQGIIDTVRSIPATWVFHLLVFFLSLPFVFRPDLGLP